jgi:osmotically-inducible protein OsmY
MGLWTASVVLREQDMTDTDIRDAVLRELAWDSRVDEAAVGVTVADRIVALTGYVRSDAEKVAAQEAAHRVHGVLDVANDLVVKVPFGFSRTDADIARAVRHVRGIENRIALVATAIAPERVREAIDAALERQASREARRIDVAVHESVVTLSGVIDSPAERRAILGVVSHARGVRAVNDRLRIAR